MHKFGCIGYQMQPVATHSLLLLLPGVLHWQSPHFFAWFGGNTSGPSILAEMLIASLNMIGFSWQSSPISTELEMVRFLIRFFGVDFARFMAFCWN